MRSETGTNDKATIFARNRARGSIELSVAEAAGRTRRRCVVEEGSLRIRLPDVGEAESEAVILNTAGGMAGGDAFSIAIDADEGARLTVINAAAEKVYRTLGDASRIDVRLSVARGAALRWLPQETILFDGARLQRSIDADIADGGSLVIAESTVFGRTAMGETVRHGELVDRWRIRKAGRLVFADTFRLGGEVAALLARPAAGGGAAACASIVVAPGDEAVAEKVRSSLEACSSEAGISAWNGIAVIRMCAKDAVLLRRDLVLMLNHLGGALPRLWTN